jgi:hypothetical protein
MLEKSAKNGCVSAEFSRGGRRRKKKKRRNEKNEAFIFIFQVDESPS